MSRTEASRPGRVGRPWRKVSAKVYSEEDFCWLCGEFVDQRLHSRHPLARTADHLIQLCHGGDPLDRANLRLAHMRCNSARSNALRHLKPEDCACALRRPCAVVEAHQPRGYVGLDPASV